MWDCLGDFEHFVLIWFLFHISLKGNWYHSETNLARPWMQLLLISMQLRFEMKKPYQRNSTAQWIIVLDERLRLFFCVQESLNACLKRQRSLIQLWAVVNVCGWVLKVVLVVHTNSWCTYSVDFSMVSFALHSFLLFFLYYFWIPSLWTRPDWRELWARITLPRQPNTTGIHRCWCSCPRKVVSVLVQCRLDGSSHNEGFKQ